MSKKEEEMTDEEKKDSVKPSKEKQEVPAQEYTIQSVLCVLVALVAIVFALFLGYNNAL